MDRMDRIFYDDDEEIVNLVSLNELSIPAHHFCAGKPWAHRASEKDGTNLC